MVLNSQIPLMALDRCKAGGQNWLQACPRLERREIESRDCNQDDVVVAEVTNCFQSNTEFSREYTNARPASETSVAEIGQACQQTGRNKFEVKHRRRDNKKI